MTAEEFKNILKEENLDIEKLNDTLLGLLSDKKLKISVAESCTGGMVSKWITDVPGAAEVFDLGVCTYSNEMKTKLLGVKKETLDTFGAVSPETAEEMAEGVRLLAGADIGISTTGIAGPTGGTAEKPVGLVYVGASTKDRNFTKKLLLSEGGKNNREGIRKLAAAAIVYFAFKLF